MSKGISISIGAVIVVGILAFAGHVVAPSTQTASISRPSLLPTSNDFSPAPLPRTALQAAAYTHFLELFGASEMKLHEPVPDFKQRITKKNFGIYITPDTSPIANDRFTGFHTGVDSEFTDTTDAVPVYAIADGTIVLARWATGYGGVIAIRHIINGVPVYAIYGHLNVASFLPADVKEVKAGQQIAVLGNDHSQETDGVRKHIHFAIYSGPTLDLRGYVPNESDLSAWLNPLDLFR